MLCQVCNKNNATVHYKTNIGGKINEKYLCPECAQKYGVTKKNAFEPIDLIDGFFGKSSDDIFGGFFAGMMNETTKKNETERVACPCCGMRFSEFLHAGKVGCAECYNTFSASLGSTIKRIHGNAEHFGKVPEGIKDEISKNRKIESLKQKLNEAIQSQEYEMAAKYRDEIRALENENGEEK